MSLLSATRSSKSEHVSYGNDGVLHIPPNSGAGTLPPKFFRVKSSTNVGEWSYPFAEMQSVYFPGTDDWAKYLFWKSKKGSLNCSLETVLERFF